MFWYVFIAMAPSILGLIPYSLNKRSSLAPTTIKKIYVVACSFVVFLMIALRHYSLGSVDSMNYYNIWIYMREASPSLLEIYMESNRMEPTFLAVVWGLARVFEHPQFMFVLSGALFAIAIGVFVYKNSENPLLSMTMFICLGLYIFMVQGLRQSISISICLFAVEYCKRRKLIRFLVLVFLASLFHRTAVVFLLVYVLYGRKLTINTKALMFAIPVILIVYTPFIITTANTVLDRDYNTAAETSGAIVASLIYVIILAFAYVYLNERNSGKKEAFFVAFTMLGASFYLLRYIGTQAIERTSFYFLIGQAIVLPDTIKRFNKKSQNIINFAAILLSVVLFIYRIYTSYTIPFLFFWQ